VYKSIVGAAVEEYSGDTWLNGSKVTAQDAEANLDAEYLSAIGQDGETWQWYVEPAKWWLGMVDEMLAWNNMSHPLPQVLSVSYGAAISSTCTGPIWSGVCTNGLNAQSYILKVNQALLIESIFSNNFLTSSR